MWLIWSIEHNAWWKPARSGYTQNKSEAGRYHVTEAIDIVADANEYTGDTPNEAMVFVGND